MGSYVYILFDINDFAFQNLAASSAWLPMDAVYHLPRGDAQVPRHLLILAKPTPVNIIAARARFRKEK